VGGGAQEDRVEAVPVLDRLRDSLRRHAALSSEAPVKAVAADVAAFAGDAPQEDDLTMVVIRRVGA
jgi:serine phosphatase RsbU (regulator of sigma subunit)